ncbi:MAG: trypsin-like peptidase domain-containing protein, partial [Planctomycetota bacterium]
MDNRTLLRQFALIFIVTFAAIFVLLRSDLVGYFAYSVEKGRLRAVRESLNSTGQPSPAAIPARAVARLVTPAVVYIETELLWALGPRRDPAVTPEGSPPRGDAAADEQDRPLPDGHPFVRQMGVGSGFIIDADEGHILTNYHVIEGAFEIRVQLADGRAYKARVVGADPETDLAVIAIEADRLHD